mgnify:CR=1 FL=1
MTVIFASVLLVPVLESVPSVGLSYKSGTSPFNNGWYNTDVYVKITGGTDGGSGVSKISYSSLVPVTVIFASVLLVPVLAKLPSVGFVLSIDTVYPSDMIRQVILAGKKLITVATKEFIWFKYTKINSYYYELPSGPEEHTVTSSKIPRWLIKYITIPNVLLPVGMFA